MQKVRCITTEPSGLERRGWEPYPNVGTVDSIRYIKVMFDLIQHYPVEIHTVYVVSVKVQTEGSDTDTV